MNHHPDVRDRIWDAEQSDDAAVTAQDLADVLVELSDALIDRDTWRARAEAVRDVIRAWGPVP